MDNPDLRGGADALWELVSGANLYVQKTAPWALAKAGRDSDLDSVLGSLARALCRLAILASPYIPGKAQSLWEMLGAEGQAARTNWQAAQDPPILGPIVAR